MKNYWFCSYFRGKFIYLPSIIVVVLSSLATACVEVSMEDSSSDPTYAAIIGKKFRVKEELWALGITTDKNYKKEVDYIDLVPGVGYSGPEVVTRDRFAKGSIIKVIRVLTAKSLFFSRVEYVVEVMGSNKYRGTEIRVASMGSTYDVNYGLSNKQYDLIDVKQ